MSEKEGERDTEREKEGERDTETLREGERDTERKIEIGSEGE